MILINRLLKCQLKQTEIDQLIIYCYHPLDNSNIKIVLGKRSVLHQSFSLCLVFSASSAAFFVLFLLKSNSILIRLTVLRKRCNERNVKSKKEKERKREKQAVDKKLLLNY